MSKGDNRKKQGKFQKISVTIYLLPLACVVVLALITILLSGRVSNEFWVKQEYTQRKALVEKRINLIERASKILNSKQTIIEINKFLDIQAAWNEKVRDCAETAKNAEKYGVIICCTGNGSGRLKAFVKTALKDKLSAEFYAVIQLTSLHFGEETKKYSTELSKLPKWWLADKEIYSNYIAAMHNELYISKYE